MIAALAACSSSSAGHVGSTVPAAVSTITSQDTNAPTTTVAPAQPDLARLPLDCSPDTVGSPLEEHHVVLACSDGWALIQSYPSCNGAPCEAQQLWSVWSGREEDDLYFGYNTYPFSYCRSRVAADGAPDWVLDVVPWPACDGPQQTIDYHAEPTTGPLRLGDVGPRTALFQLDLIDGEYPVGAADGNFGWTTARAVRMVQHDGGLPVTGDIDDATLALRNQTTPCISMAADGRLGARLTGNVTCADALAGWAEFVGLRPGTTTALVAGWTCTPGTDQPVLEPAVAGRCSRSDASFAIVSGWDG
jgi:hypothetical protein